MGRVTSEHLRTRINLPLLFTLSVIPDIDILLTPFIEHRGPTHSILAAIIVFAPFFIVYGRRATPYCVAFIQHSFIGDYVTGGRIQLLWPITTQYYGIETSITSPTNIAVESIMLLISMLVMFGVSDLARFVKPNLSNLILLVPTLTVLLPTILWFPLSVPVWLIPQHLVYLVLFSAAIIITLTKILRDGRHTRQ